MNKLISVDQVNALLKVLGEMPAKLSYEAIGMLAALPDHVEDKEPAIE